MDDMFEFDWLNPPLPPWAIAVADKDTYHQVGLQLFTKNSRKRGNGFIYSIEEDKNELHPYDWVFTVYTDMGNRIRYTETELAAAYEIGDYIMDPEEALAARVKLEEPNTMPFTGEEVEVLAFALDVISNSNGLDLEVFDAILGEYAKTRNLDEAVAFARSEWDV